MHANANATPLPSIDYRWLVLASLLVSVWLIALDPLVNRDAIIYLRSADAYLEQGFTASQQLHGRPLLSLCMAWLHQLTGLPLLYAGLLLTTASYALMCTAFVATVHLLGGDRRVQMFAAAVILFHPWLNHTRADIMRDPAYWALLLVSFRALLLYLREPCLRHQAQWTAAIMLAGAFRFEGVFFAVLAPLLLLGTRDLQQPLRHCLRLLLPLLAVLAVLALALVSLGESLEFPTLHRYLQNLQAMPGDLASVAAESAQPMLQGSAVEDAPWAVLAGLLAILLVNIGRAFGGAWLLVLLAGWKAGLLGRFRRDDQWLLHGHLLIALLYLGLFVLANRFMLERYANQLVLFALLYVPFVLNSLWHKAGWRRALVGLLLLAVTVDTLHNGDRSKAFIRDAAEWVAAETPADTGIVTNERYIAYFGQRQVEWEPLLANQFDMDAILSRPDLWQQSDYIVMYVRRARLDDFARFVNRHGLREIRVFEGGRHGRVSVVATTIAEPPKQARRKPPSTPAP